MHMKWLRKTVRDFIACERGVAFIEFAYCSTLLMLLLWGGVELSRYVLTMQKLEDAASQETNIISTTDPRHPINQNEMDSILQAVSLMMTPYQFSFSGNNLVIISDIYAPPPSPAALARKPPPVPVPPVQWRYCNPSYGGSVTRSKLGPVGHPANMSAYPGFSMAFGDEVIVAEIYYQFVPIIRNFITTGLLPVNTPTYAEAMSVPRFGLLTGLVGTSFQSNCP